MIRASLEVEVNMDPGLHRDDDKGDAVALLVLVLVLVLGAMIPRIMRPGASSGRGAA